MPVFRVEKVKDYTIMPNTHLRNRQLSLRAKGLLCQMLSLPPEWNFTLQGLAYINKEGLDAITTVYTNWSRQDILPATEYAMKRDCFGKWNIQFILLQN